MVEGPRMSERERIFARIREALAESAPVPEAAGPGLPDAGSEAYRRVLPAVGVDFADRVALFARQSAELKTVFLRVPDLAALGVELHRLRDAENWARVASHAGGLTDAAVAALTLPVLRTDQAYDKSDLAACPVGISECEVLVAQTGSVLVTTRSSGGRALSVLPPHHVVLARSAQLVAGLPDAFAHLRQRYGDHFPSMISFITGPSRTGDIERILVLGAHGPRQLTVFLLD